MLLNFSLLIFFFFFCIKVAVTESSEMDITLLADFIAPRSVQDISLCKYSTTHLPKECQSLFSLKFSSYNCVNTSAQQAYLLEQNLFQEGESWQLACLPLFPIGAAFLSKF